MRFELTVRKTPNSGFRNRRTRPLCDPSLRWRAREELNLRPSDPQSDALSAELRAQIDHDIVADFGLKSNLSSFFVKMGFLEGNFW